MRAALAFALLAAACGRDGAPAPHEQACATLGGENPVQIEMRRLECALERTVVAIGRDDLPAIEHELHAVHEARTATERALHEGAYQPRGDLAAFVALDEAFHDRLEHLLEASRAGDHGATSTALGEALGACQGCHATFRAPSDPR